ncbi:MAG: ErfK/YbiS/YcfS/YnhG family protein [Frankiales bacterium]|nr:ErfK/YbiS/YcfS/YnhG family protein [Frankiales bacterium]
MVGCGPRVAGDVVAGADPVVPAPVVVTTPAPVAVVVTASIADGATITSTQQVRIKATNGRLQTVALRSADGSVVAQAANVTSWTSPVDLPPLRSYTVDVTTKDTAGTPATFTRAFTTAAPTAQLKTDIYPYGDQEVGIGMPITVHLNQPVGTDKRAVVEAALTVEADKDFGDGSWAWLSDTELHYRPAKFWPANTHVTVHSDLVGVHIGPGIWGTTDRDVTFHTGRAMVIRIDDATHKMTVTVDGKLARTVAVSLGKKDFETRSGIKTISEKFVTYRMRSATIGVAAKNDPNFYDVVVPYAMRITNSGEFIHGAPWNKLIGKADASHGCTNVALSDAIWLFDRVLPGDPVVTTGTVKKMEGWNGLGAEWNYEFSYWKTLSAL